MCDWMNLVWWKLRFMFSLSNILCLCLISMLHWYSLRIPEVHRCSEGSREYITFLFYKNICCSPWNLWLLLLSDGEVNLVFFFLLSVQVMSFTYQKHDSISQAFRLMSSSLTRRAADLVKATKASWEDTLHLSFNVKGFQFPFYWCRQDVPSFSSSSSVCYSSSVATCSFPVMTTSLPGEKLVLQLLQTGSHSRQ